MVTSQPTPTFPPAPPPRRRSKKRLILFLCSGAAVLALLLALLGGRTYKKYRLAAGAAGRFHEQLNRADYDGIYEEASDEFRRSGTHERFVKVMENVQKKLGVAGKMSPLGFHVYWQNGRTFADAVFNTEFSQGHGQESFIWVMQNSQLRLYSYHIDSPQLQ